MTKLLYLIFSLLLALAKTTKMKTIFETKMKRICFMVVLCDCNETLLEFWLWSRLLNLDPLMGHPAQHTRISLHA